MKHLFFAFFVFSLLFSCGRREGITIIGKIHNYQHSFIYVETRGRVDSVEVEENGSFVYEKQFRGPQFLKIYGYNRRDFVMLLCDTTENINFEANTSSIKNTAQISGSRGTNLLRQLSKHFSATQRSTDSLKHVYQEFLQYGSFSDSELDTLQKNIDSQFKAAIVNEKEFIISFVKKNKKSLAAMTALYQSLDSKGEPLLLEDTANVRYFLMVDSSLRKRYRFSPYVKEFRKSVRKLAESLDRDYDKQSSKTFLKIGDKAPAFTMRRADGEKIKLRQYKGKWVLVDFWASWCIQNRENNPKILKIWMKHRKQNFDILQVSLDKDVQIWQAAVQRDSLPWVGQVSDFKYWESDAVVKYGVTKIPANFLVDPQGSIAAINISPEKLAQRLKTLKK